ncbi:MAG TPA: hypothetical protein VL359_03520, partial [bacterium]|nr:hypothetical protein [bacterium]
MRKRALLVAVVLMLVGGTLWGQQSGKEAPATVATSRPAIPPQPIISRGVPAFASSGNASHG